MVQATVGVTVIEIAATLAQVAKAAQARAAATEQSRAAATEQARVTGMEKVAMAKTPIKANQHKPLHCISPFASMAGFFDLSL